MATITNLVGATDTVNDTTLVTGASLTCSVDDWLVVLVACPNSGASGAAPTITVDDSDGLNTYTQRKIVNRDPGAAGDGTTLGIFTCQVTDNVTNGTLTVTLSDAAGSKTVQVYRVRPGTNEVISFVAAGTGTTGNASTFNSGAVTVTNGNIIFGVVSLEDNAAPTGDSDTTNGSWSTLVSRVADNGSDSNSTSQGSQYKTVTATGSQTWNGDSASGTAKQYAADYLVLGVAMVLTAATGSYTITGTNPSLEHGRVVVALAGSYAITGTDVSLSATGSKVVNIEPGSYAITGTDASTLQGYKPTADAGSYAITGTDTPVLHGWVLDATTGGSYVITGTDTPVLQGRKFVPDAGSYVFTGTDVGLNKSGTYSIVIGPGSYAITGTDATPVHGYVIGAGAGSYAMTGTNATTTHGLAVFLNTPGSYLITGTDVTLHKTASAPTQIFGILKTAPYSHTLMVKAPRGSTPQPS